MPNPETTSAPHNGTSRRFSTPRADGAPRPAPISSAPRPNPTRARFGAPSPSVPPPLPRNSNLPVLSAPMRSAAALPTYATPPKRAAAVDRSWPPPKSDSQLSRHSCIRLEPAGRASEGNREDRAPTAEVQAQSRAKGRAFESTGHNAEAVVHRVPALDPRRSVEAARTSWIDAGWEGVSVERAHMNELPVVTARPRLETLPGLGPDGKPIHEAQEMEWTTTLVHARASRSTPVRSSPPPFVPTPRFKRRWPIIFSTLAAALSVCLAKGAVIAWKSTPGIAAPTSHSSTSSPRSGAPAIAGIVPSDPSSSPIAAKVSAAAAPARAPGIRAAATSSEPLPLKPRYRGKPTPRSIEAAGPRPIEGAARPASEDPVPRSAGTGFARAHQSVSVPSDNPY